MAHYWLESDTEITVSDWGIPEPVGASPAPVLAIDYVLVPLLVIDRVGYRVGYGKGFYDRFLTDCRDDVRTIGLSFFDPIDEVVDKDPWDIPLDHCITPKGLITFAQNQ